MNKVTAYNQNQQLAINAPESKIVITAPPGAGKTATIVGAVDKYAADNPMDHMVAITFTKKAAAELQNRIDALNVEISTIHSWSYRQLQRFAAMYDFTIALLDDEEIKEILIRICKMKHQYYINQFQLFAYVMGNYNIDIDDRVKRLFEEIRINYIEFKRKNGLYDFTDLPLYLLDVLEEYNEDIEDVDALFVDEAQDIDPIQLEIFCRIKAKKYVFIGDVKQAIYGFRQADAHIFEKLEELGYTFYYLDTNYRSYQEIIDFADTVHAISTYQMGSDFNFIDIEWDQEEIIPSPINCVRGTGGSVYCIPDLGRCFDITNGRMCSDDLIIRTLVSDKNTQILCRTNKEVKKLQSFGIQNVSTIHQAKGLEYGNVILTDFIVNCDEERNVAYVGMTRAKNTLCIMDFDVLACIVCRDNLGNDRKLF